MIVDIVIDLPVFNSFTYHVDKNLEPFISIGKRVLVPFAKRRVTGYIVGFSDNTKPRELKDILDVLDEKPLFPSGMISFFRWIADYYMHPMGAVIRGALPSGLNIYDVKTICITPTGKSLLAANRLTPVEAEILSRLERGDCRLKDLGKAIKREIPHSTIYAMENCGWISSKQELKGGMTKPRTERYVSLLNSELDDSKISPQRKKVIDTLIADGDMSVKKLKSIMPTSSSLLKPLEKSGHIKIFEKKIYRDPFGEPIISDSGRLLTDDQEKVVTRILNSLGKGFSAYLLAGVTGSGKTEVYMQLTAKAIEYGHSVLVLVPEIALISQMERRFRSRFGECVAILHSGLSGGERYDQWMRILNREVSIAIGARSAIFAPFDKVGIIIVDEEHDTSYKQESGLRYNARDLAVVRAKQNNGVVLLGSATPSLQSYYNVVKKKFFQVTLSNRVEKQPLPEIAVVDLSKSRDFRGIRQFVTPELQSAIKATLERNEQTLLFLNRRGFAGFPLCMECGESLKCKDCDITLTFHRGANAYKCHYCGFSRSSKSDCRVCGSNKIKLLGLGTERLESAMKALFPKARVLRMDRDTTIRKGSLLQILKAIRNHDVDIIIGTQMVAKGHDFPAITLVGVICADLSLNFPDFRAGERTFQLLAQVAGRAGRGTVPGRVVLQTYNPQHFSILAAKAQDFKIFYEREIIFRRKLNYPPFSRMIQLQIAGKDKEKTNTVALKLGDSCHVLKKKEQSFLKSIDVLGPIASPLPKIARYYRWQILLKGLNVKSLHRFVHQMMNENSYLFHHRSVKVAVDVDPFFMM